MLKYGAIFVFLLSGCLIGGRTISIDKPGAECVGSACCVPNCTARCAGDNGCGDTCPENCIAPTMCVEETCHVYDPNGSTGPTGELPELALTLSPLVATIEATESVQLTASMSDGSPIVFTVDGLGYVSTTGLYTAPITPGTNTVTATSQMHPGLVQATTITVIRKLVSVSISADRSSIAVDCPANLRASANYAHVSEDETANASWSSSNEGVAIVSQPGVIERAGPGTAVITASYAGKTATFEVEAPVARFAYVGTNESTIGLYAWNEHSSRLLARGSFRIGMKQAQFTIDPSRRYLLAISRFENIIRSFAIDSESGKLTAIDSWPITNADNERVHITAHPNGDLVYASTGNPPGVSVYRLDIHTGALSHLSDFPTTGKPTNLVISDRGDFLYVPFLELGSVAAFAIDPNDGSLVEVLGSPMSVVNDPWRLSIHPSGNFAIVSSNFEEELWLLSKDPQTGALTIPAPNPIPIDNPPSKVAFHPNGKFAYVTDRFSQGIFMFSVDSLGVFTRLSSSPLDIDGFPIQSEMDPSGEYLYVANSDGWVSVFGSNPVTGELTFLQSAPALDMPLSVQFNISDSYEPKKVEKFIIGTEFELDWVNVYSWTSSSLTRIQRFTTAPPPIEDPSGPYGIAVSKELHRAWIAMKRDDAIEEFDLNPQTGMLTAVSGAQYPTPGNPMGLALDQASQFVYAAVMSGVVVGQEINQETSGLTAISGSPWTTPGGSVEIKLAPNGERLVVDSSGSAYAYVRSDGRIGSFTQFGEPGDQSGDFDASGRFFVTTNFLSKTVRAFDSLHSFQKVGEVVRTVAPYFAITDPLGEYVFGAVPEGLVVFRLNPRTGELTEVSGSPFALKHATSSIYVEAGGEFLFAATETLDMYSIDRATGAPTYVTSSPDSILGVAVMEGF